MKRMLTLFFTVLLAVLSCGFALADETDAIDMFDDAYMQEYGLCDSNGRLSLRSVEWDGSTCYAYMTDGAVYLCEPGQAPQKLCALPVAPENFGLTGGTLTADEMAQLDETVTHIAVNGGVVYGYNVYSGGWGVMDENGMHWNENRLDFSCLFREDDSSPDRIVRSFIVDRALVVLAYTQDAYGGYGYAIISFDPETGESKKYTVEGLCGACRGAGSALICLFSREDAYSLCTLDIADGKTAPVDVAVDMQTPEGGLGGLAYDADADAIFLSANGKVWRSLRGQRFEAVSEVQTVNITNDACAWTLADGRYVLFLDGGMHIRGEDEITGRQLTFSGSLQPAARNLYQSRHPDVILNFIDQADTESLTRNILIQDDTVDIYILQADYTFTSMKSKGLAASLSASEIIAADVAQMDSAVQGVLCDDAGNVLAYPESLMLWRYGINAGYWRMLWPDRPLPETFGEVLDAWIDWERNLAQDYPGLGFDGEDFDYAQWVEEIIRIYVMQHDAGGLPDLNAPALKSALEKLREICEIRVSEGRTVHGEPDPQLATDSETGPGLIFYITLSDAMDADAPVQYRTADDYLYGEAKGEFVWLPLSFGAEPLKNTDGRMSLYVVNPYSKHMEEALSFMECMTEVQAAPYLYYAIHPKVNAPLEDANYEETRARYAGMQEMYQKAIETAKADGRDTEELETELRYYEAYLAEDGYRWKIAPETIRRYRAMISEKPLNVHAALLYIAAGDTVSMGLIRSACDRYADGSLSLDTMLQEISSKMEMICRENR